MLDHARIRATLPPFIISDVPLHDKNWFGTGGAARYFCAPTTIDQLRTALAWARNHAIDITVLGAGANVLISDDGIDGLVISPAFNQIEQKKIDDAHVLITAGAGVSMHDLIAWCLDHHILGLEEFSGIPGTVGGSVYINLHYFEFLLDQFLVSATVIKKATGTVSTVDAGWFAFGYDQSKLIENTHILIDATFKLHIADDELSTTFARGRRQEIIRHRVRRYPSTGTCGSFFRNFHDHEVALTINGTKMIFVAYYLDKIGVKGHLAVGNATVSHQHANMLVNKGGASTADIIAVARRMQELVHDQFGITPQPECVLLGFQNYPLAR